LVYANVSIPPELAAQIAEFLCDFGFDDVIAMRASNLPLDCAHLRKLHGEIIEDKIHLLEEFNAAIWTRDLFIEPRSYPFLAAYKEAAGMPLVSDYKGALGGASAKYFDAACLRSVEKTLSSLAKFLIHYIRECGWRHLPLFPDPSLSNVKRLPASPHAKRRESLRRGGLKIGRRRYIVSETHRYTRISPAFYMRAALSIAALIRAAAVLEPSDAQR
jgi:hypothetical protein